MAALQRQSPIPLYHQLRQLLAGHIASGAWQPGDMIPTEEQLQEQYQLSRTTVRQALKELESEGLIKRYRGRGSFVTQPKYSHSPEPHLGLTDTLLRRGLQPGWRVLSAGMVPAPIDVAERLAIDASQPLFRLVRLRMANEEPIGYHVAHVAPHLTGAVDASRLAVGGSLHYLKGHGHLKNSYANRIVEAIAAPAQVARQLAIAPGSPLLLIRRVVLSEESVPLEDMRAMYRGDRLQYHIRHMPEVATEG